MVSAGRRRFDLRRTGSRCCTMPARSRAHRILIACIVAVLALVASGAAVVQRRTTASCAAMQQKVAALEQVFQQRDHRRQPLFGTGTDGSAFAGYAAALAASRALQREHAVLVATLPHHDDSKVAGREALRDRWRPAVDLLSEAARRTDARPEPFARGQGSGLVNLLDARWLVNMAVFEARALRLRGEPRAAVERTLAAATLGADLVHSGVLIHQMIGAALVAIAADEAWPDAALQQLDAGALELLAAGLERLDHGLPTSVDLVAELRFVARGLQDPQATGVFGARAEAWRYGFSPRWMLADAFLQVAAAAERITAEQRLSWPQREALLQLELGAVADSGNPVTAMLAPNLSAAEQTLREVAARVRLLRMAVDVRRGVDGVPLQDPLGDGPFGVARDAGGVVFHSAGGHSGRKLVRSVRS
jgi:hypothetical protein